MGDKQPYNQWDYNCQSSPNMIHQWDLGPTVRWQSPNCGAHNFGVQITGGPASPQHDLQLHCRPSWLYQIPPSHRTDPWSPSTVRQRHLAPHVIRRGESCDRTRRTALSISWNRLGMGRASPLSLKGHF